MNAASTPPPELHLPDLPEVAVQLGSAPQWSRAAQPWPRRLREALSSYLPLLLMAGLAAGTWWLVRNSPGPLAPSAQRAVRQAPDYSMQGFSVTRFAPDGQVVLRIDGDVLQHFPATDRLEITGVRIHAIGADGRTTDATAQRALANGDGSEVQLIGGAQVVTRQPKRDTVEIRGEFLHAFLRFERISSHLPVQLLRPGSQVRAGGLEYDHLTGQATLKGPVSARFTPTGGADAKAEPEGAGPAAAPGPVSATVPAPVSAPASASPPALSASAPR